MAILCFCVIFSLYVRLSH